MKKVLTLFGLLILSFTFAHAQKFAFIDTEYILKNISSYETAQEQLNIISKKWQSEIEKKQQEVKTMYQSYQSDLAFLSAEQKTKRENAIVAKEKELQELNQKYFAPEGLLFQQREKLIKPIQDAIYETVKDISNAKGYQLILDRATAEGVIFASPKIDISNEVLQQLGYTK